VCQAKLTSSWLYVQIKSLHIIIIIIIINRMYSASQKMVPL